MHSKKVNNLQGDLITDSQACELTNLGRTTVRKLAEEAGAVRKIGRCYRIKKNAFFDYIENMYS
jgi:excisionase family DNA binding protein